MTRSVPLDLGDSALSTYPRSDLDPTSTHHRSTERKGRRGTGLGVFSPSRPRRHHGVQGWPAIPRALRYNHLYRDRQNFTSRHPGAPASSYPIKGQARAQQGETKSKTQARSQAQISKGTQPADQHLKQSPCTLTFSLRPGLSSLSRNL
jgi:hypothetical protein